MKAARPCGDWEQSARDQFVQARHLRWTLRLRRCLRWAGAPLPKVEAVCAVREPIGLELAAAFENSHYLFQGLGEVTSEFFRQEMLKPKERVFTRNWFDLELKAMLGIDVFRTTFPREKGYGIYENAFARVLVYRFEALSNLAAILGEFLLREVPEVVNRNLGEHKPYGEIYRKIKAQLRLPQTFVQAQCNTRMMEHFYSVEERRAFAARWSEA